MDIPIVDRPIVEKLLHGSNIEYFSLEPVLLQPNKWCVYIPSNSEDPGVTFERLLTVHPATFIEHIVVHKTKEVDRLLHEVIFYFVVAPDTPN